MQKGSEYFLTPWLLKPLFHCYSIEVSTHFVFCCTLFPSLLLSSLPHLLMSDLIAFALTLRTRPQCNKLPVDALRLGLHRCIPESLSFYLIPHRLFPLHSFISSSNAIASRHTAWYCDHPDLTECNITVATAQSWIRNDQQLLFSSTF